MCSVLSADVQLVALYVPELNKHGEKKGNTLRDFPAWRGSREAILTMQWRGYRHALRGAQCKSISPPF